MSRSFCESAFVEISLWGYLAIYCTFWDTSSILICLWGRFPHFLVIDDEFSLAQNVCWVVLGNRTWQILLYLRVGFWFDETVFIHTTIFRCKMPICPLFWVLRILAVALELRPEFWRVWGLLYFGRKILPWFLKLPLLRFSLSIRGLSKRISLHAMCRFPRLGFK